VKELHLTSKDLVKGANISNLKISDFKDGIFEKICKADKVIYTPDPIILKNRLPNN
jgi:hypothetical protein